MTPLEHKALATLPMSKEAVEFFYAVLCKSETETAVRVRKLCISHERLRSELEGMDVLLKDDNAEILKQRERLAAALALTDTGSAEFREAFPTLSVGGHYFPRDSVPGWRVVDRIREVLLG